MWNLRLAAQQLLPKPVASGEGPRRNPFKIMIRILAVAFLIFLFSIRHFIYISWTLFTLYANWPIDAQSFTLSLEHDNFDPSFQTYREHQLTARPDYEDLVPPILHHIALGEEQGQWRDEWNGTVQSCIDIHRGWESHMWTDETATAFVSEHYPHLYEMWKGYPFLVQRVDALRFMVLHHFGGIVLDTDLQCRRALGPLRRFQFVAPTAHPAGFSVGFMVAMPRHAFIEEVLKNLPVYNHRWLGLPYTTVMLSTGCHFASTIHTLQKDRSELKILPGPLHSLNGRVKTPLFVHLGSSSWHSWDGATIKKLGEKKTLISLGSSLAGMGLLVGLMLVIRRRMRLRRTSGRVQVWESVKREA